MRLKKVPMTLALGGFLILSSGCQPNSAAAAEPDWNEVEAAPGHLVMRAMLNVTRALDIWHEGTREEIEVLFQDGEVVDGHGNKIEVSPEQWKGMVLLVHDWVKLPKTHDFFPFATEADSTPYPFEDGRTDVQGFLYHIRIKDRLTLTFQTVGPDTGSGLRTGVRP